MNPFLRWSLNSIPVVAVFLAAIGIWQVAVSVYEIHPIILPSPVRVFETLWEARVELGRGFLATGLAALLGLGTSLLLGVVVAIAFSQAQWIRRAFYPYVVFLQTVPIVAIAPLLVIWSGYEFRTVVLVAAIVCAFPIVSNMTTGLISIDQNLRDLFRLYGATRWQELVKLRLPHALSHLILGLRISAGLAVIGAIVGEFFVATNATDFAGLGTLMTGWQNQAKTSAVMAAILVSTLLGMAMLASVNLLGGVLLRKWTRSADFENE